MRDPKRIDDYVKDLAEYWHLVPDWRFGQFMFNFLSYVTKETRRDIFFIEDKEMFELLAKYFKENGVENE